MITVNNMAGGLGNQLFQYAAGFAHARKLNTDFVYPSRPPHIGTSSDNGLRPNGLFEIFNLSAKQGNLASAQYGMPYYESSFSYNPLPNTPNLILCGYFQSERYFKEYESEIRSEFTFKQPPPKKVDDDTVAIHVRRGDYLKYREHHPTCSLEYYKKAMNLFKGKKFMIFTDDKDWCKKYFDLHNTVISTQEKAEEDLQLMSLCSHHIIANSSFSWWGAWLSNKKGSIVVAPEKWFGPSYWTHDTKDLYLDNWKII